MACSYADHLAGLGRRFRICSGTSRIRGMITPGAVASAVINVVVSLITWLLRRSLAQDRLSGPRVCQGHILECANAPALFLLREHGKDYCINLMRPGRVRRAGREATPKMDNRHVLSNMSDVDQLIFQRRVAIDRFVDRGV